MALQGLLPGGSPDPTGTHHLNLVSYIDYLILNFWLGNRDWPRQNFYAARENVPDSGGWTFFSWDAEWTTGLATATNFNNLGFNLGVCVPFQNIRTSAEFRLRFADRVREHFKPGGPFYVNPANPAYDPLYPDNNRPAALYAAIAEPLASPLVGESARWGDQWVGTPYTVNQQWRTELTNLTGTYFRVRTGIVLDQFAAAGLLPSLPAPQFSPTGGEYSLGDTVTITAATGTVYYTVNGPDPRIVGGGIHPAALIAGPPVALTNRVVILARAWDGLQWSALAQETFNPQQRLYLVQQGPALRFTWNPIQAVPYTLQRSPSLLPPSWTDTLTVATNGPAVVELPAPPGEILQYYRLHRPEP
jgi:hypothetical protein